jgi:hypothetical protein
MAGFDIPDNDVAFNANQSIWMSTDIDILTAGLNGVGVVSGCGVTAQGSPDMTVAIAAGFVRVASFGTITVAAGNGTVTTADATNPRIDLVTVSDTGTKTVTAGTAAANPKAPALPSGHVALAMVYVPANDTTIESDHITDKRVILGTNILAPERDDLNLSGATVIDFTSPTSDDADLVSASETGMACRATFTAEGAETKRHLYVSHALGTGDFDVRMRIPTAIYSIQHTGTSTGLIGLFVADSSLTAATRQSIDYQPVRTATTHGDDQQRAIFFTGTTPNGMYMNGVPLPLVLRLVRVGTTISGYVSTDNGRVWARVGNTATSSVDFQRIGLVGWGGGTGTTQKLVALVHWLRKF